MADLIILPSIKSADWTRLGEEVKELERAGADMLHFDVADGHFVNDLAIGPKLVGALRRITFLPFDVHLMFQDPETIIPKYIEAGADTIIFHIEAVSEPERVLKNIKEKGKKAGVALKINTPEESIRNILPFVDMVNLMCVDLEKPGELSEGAFLKIETLGKIIKETKSFAYIQADGAVSMKTRDLYEKAGAKSLVVGYPIFSRRGEYGMAIKELKQGFL